MSWLIMNVTYILIESDGHIRLAMTMVPERLLGGIAFHFERKYSKSEG